MSRKLDVVPVVDACTNIGKAKSHEDALEKCYVEMVLEVASDVDYDCDVCKGDNEIVTYT
jgi:hypothetical protein